MKYEEMKLEIIEFDQQDIIVTSGEEGQQGGGGDPYQTPEIDL